MLSEEFVQSDTENYEVSESFIRKIKEDIKKSGVPLEIEVSSKLKEDDWNVISHDYYVDDEEKISREIDVAAWKRFEIRGRLHDYFNMYLMVECKRSLEKPWVFYTSAKGEEIEVPQFHDRKMHQRPRARTVDQLVEEYKWTRHIHHFSSMFDKNAIIGYEPFMKGKGERIFEASMQVIKALAYSRVSISRRLSLVSRGLFLWYPVIVFDGHMFEYTLDEEVKPARYLQYLVRHRFRDPSTSALVGDGFLIDVLRKDFLAEYLRILRKECQTIKIELVT